MSNAVMNGTAAAVAKPRLWRLADLHHEFLADAEAAHEAYQTGRPRGPITGHKKLDQELGGVLQAGLHVLHSNSGTGKTAFAWQMACSASHPSVYLSVEMGPIELLKRLTARVTGTFLGRLKSGEFPPDRAIALMEQAVGTARGVHLIDATRAYADPDYLLRVAETAKGNQKHLLVVVDSLHAWVGSAAAGASEYESVSAALMTLGQIAQQLACPVLLIAERSRAAMEEGGLNASAGSRRFEYGAETVISLDRSRKWERPDGCVNMDLSIDKNRHGAHGRKLSLVFNGALQQFTEPES